MDQRAATQEVSSKDPNLSPMLKVGDLYAPKAPADIASARLQEGVLTDLVVRLAYTNARLSTDWVQKQLHFSLPLAQDVLDAVCREGLVEETMRVSDARSHYRITDRGREYAGRLMEVCGYIGPAPVSLESYTAMLRWQFANATPVRPEHVVAALSGMVVSSKVAQFAGLAVSSGRSLFVYGPPGNGKSSLGRMIRAAYPDDYWIPYAISVGDNIIRLHDPHVHNRIEVPCEQPDAIDQRWIRIKRPLVIVGGELTLDLLDLIYIPSQRIYEAPPHLKANGGVFLVDDFGRERVSPEQLLNRFITPMEYQIDYFTLRTGQKIMVPLRHVLIIATNLSLETVTDPAFLRRMGYRVYLGAPTPEQYVKIFRSYAQQHGAAAAPEVLEQLLERYRVENRELRACEPRDLIERSRDICRFQGKSLELTPKVLDLAWMGYFGTEQLRRRDKSDSAKEAGGESRNEHQSGKATS
jgi:predicted ATPase with chaperone activity